MQLSLILHSSQNVMDFQSLILKLKMLLILREKDTLIIKYEGRSKSSRKSVIIFLFGKSTELNYYSYIDKYDLYLNNKFCCSGMNTIITVVAMETVHHDYRPTFVHFCKKSMFDVGMAFDSLPCFCHQTLYEQSSIYLR